MNSDVKEVLPGSTKWSNHCVFTRTLLNGLKGNASLNGDKLIARASFSGTRATEQWATNTRQDPCSAWLERQLTLAFTDDK